jgi:hypothetical protein
MKIFPRFPQKVVLLPQCGSQISKHFQALGMTTGWVIKFAFKPLTNQYICTIGQDR